MSIVFLLIFLMLGIIFSISNVDAQKNTFNTTEVDNWYFQIEVPDNWIYEEYSDFPATQLLGFGPGNVIALIPNEFNFNEIKKGNITEIAVANFQQDTGYHIKNAPLNVYLQYKLESQNALKILLQEKINIDGEKAIKIYGEGIGPFDGIKYLEYVISHNNEPYFIMYSGNLENYDKYLPEFEKMVETFKFVD